MKKSKKQPRPALDANDFRMKFEIMSPLLADDPHDYIQHIDGTLNIFDEDHEEFSIPVGQVKAYKVELASAEEAGEPLEFIFDTVNDELADFYSTLFDGNEFSNEIEELLDAGSGSDLLIVDRVEIDPEFRGQNLGLIAALKTIEKFSGNCAYVALRPFPLQFALYQDQPEKLKLLKYDGFEKSEERAIKRLQEYWSQLGFKQVLDTDVFILSPAYKLPTSVEKLCRRRTR